MQTSHRSRIAIKGTVMRVILTIILCSFLCFTVQTQNKSESDDFSYALKLYNEKFYDLAAQQFIRFINNYSTSTLLDEAGYYTGMAYFELKDYENARIEFQNVAVNFPDSKKSAESWYMVGECFYLMDNLAEAAKAFERVKILYPTYANAAQSALQAGKIYLQLNKYEKAEHLLNLIQDRYYESTTYFPALLYHGILHVRKHEYDQAIQKFNRVLEGESNKELKAEAFYQLGDLYRLQSDFDGALEFLNQVIGQYKEEVVYNDAVLILSGILILKEDYTKAQPVLINALKQKPKASVAKKMNELLGDCYYMQNQYALARNHYDLCSIDDQDSLFVLRRLKSALTWYKQAIVDKALSEVSEIIARQSYQKYPYFDIARERYFTWLLETGQYSRGITEYYAMNMGVPEPPQIKIIIIKLMQHNKDWHGVLRELEPAAQNALYARERDNFYIEIGRTYEALENYNQALFYYRKLVEECSASELRTYAEERIIYLNTFKMADQNIGVGKLALLIGDILNNRSRGELLVELGKIYFDQLKDYQNALLQFQEAVKHPENSRVKADIYFHIGECYLNLAKINQDSTQMLPLAKRNFGFAMEGIASATKPDLISWRFVQMGIYLDNPPPEKQITYIETLMQKYPDSPLREEWLHSLTALYPSAEKQLRAYDLLISQLASNETMPTYLYERAQLKEKSLKQNAVDDYKRIVADYPKSNVAVLALNQVALDYENQNMYNEAIQLQSKLITDYYYTTTAESVEERIGNNYIRTGDNDKAIKIYSKLLRTVHYDDAVMIREFISGYQLEWLYKIGQASFLADDIDNARHYLNSYLMKTSIGIHRAEASLLLGDLFMKQNDPKIAVMTWKKVAPADSLRYNIALRKIGDAYYKLGNYKSAANYYMELAKRLTSAAAEEQAEVHALNIIALIRDGNIKQAQNLENLYNKKFKSYKNYHAAFQFEYGDYYRIDKKYDSAVKYYNKVKKSYAKSDYADNAEYHLALVYLALNKQNEALEILTKFSTNYPESEKLGMVLNTLGGIYFRSEKYESALTSFKSAMSKPMTIEDRKSVMSNLIKAYTFVNFWDAALGLSREYIDTYPDAVDVIDKEIIMAQAYVYLNQHDRAVELLKEAKLHADTEKEPEVQFYIGDAYLKAGQYENAIAEFVKIPLLSRKTKLQWEASALFYSGQAYEKLGRIDDAVRMYEEIVKRPGIDIVLKKDAQKRINQIRG
jgi:tetratricopeptide (TPR) repeat protein